MAYPYNEGHERHDYHETQPQELVEVLEAQARLLMLESKTVHIMHKSYDSPAGSLKVSIDVSDDPDVESAYSLLVIPPLTRPNPPRPLLGFRALVGEEPQFHYLEPGEDGDPTHSRVQRICDAIFENNILNQEEYLFFGAILHLSERAGTHGVGDVEYIRQSVLGLKDMQEKGVLKNILFRDYELDKDSVSLRLREANHLDEISLDDESSVSTELDIIIESEVQNIEVKDITGKAVRIRIADSVGELNATPFRHAVPDDLEKLVATLGVFTYDMLIDADPKNIDLDTLNGYIISVKELIGLYGTQTPLGDAMVDHVKDMQTLFHQTFMQRYGFMQGVSPNDIEAVQSMQEHSFDPAYHPNILQFSAPRILNLFNGREMELDEDYVQTAIFLNTDFLDLNHSSLRLSSSELGAMFRVVLKNIHPQLLTPNNIYGLVMYDSDMFQGTDDME